MVPAQVTGGTSTDTGENNQPTSQWRQVSVLGICLSINLMKMRILGFFLIATLTVFLVLFVLRPQLQSAKRVNTRIQVPAPSVYDDPHPLDAPSSVSEKDFYQTIIDNNLFRPLILEVAEPPPRYELLGTTISHQPQHTQAMILDTRENQLSIVQAGEQIGEAIVLKIEKKRVILQTDQDTEMILYAQNILFY